MVRVTITGVCGRMGSTVLRLAMEDGGLEVVGVTEAKNHPSVGNDVAAIIGPVGKTLVIENSLDKTIGRTDVVIDFTSPQPALEHFRMAREKGKAIVIGATGFPEESLAEMRKAEDVRAVISPNMSVGMNLMFDLVGKLSRKMKDDYDIEIVEMHHKLKKDAPSGTALKIKEIVEMSDPSRDWIEVFGRQGITGTRKKEEIAVLSLRGGDVVGEHTIIFAGTGERLEVTHRAYSRENFARGALIAAKWIVSQDCGIYSMKDVLGL